MKRKPTPAIKDVTCSSWEKLIKELFADSLNTELDRFRTPYVFRGLSQDYALEPSVNRLGHDDPIKLRNIEHRLVDSFRKYAHGHADAERSIWHLISLAQHHGLPTRLLDWTYSPFVAMHFATCSSAQMDKKGVIWCVDRWQLQAWLPPKLQKDLTKNSTGLLSIELIAKNYKTLDQFPDSDIDNDFMLFFEPPSLDERIVNQGALFSMASRVDLDIDAWLNHICKKNTGTPLLCKRVILPRELKWEVRDKLDHANIQERVLFPGLDGLSAWLKRWYTRKVAHDRGNPA